ncbi:tryptophan synthase subunit alpha [Thermosulfurimonas marina]|uniref:Tryptophan synthase alpha chain n=1 Tax=Thermosulfurimonas marina TaxID=2047767 RepID=A0A6H1WRZ6_9BACT|nr:tryptophan synthase subunit alpha [Thermosulfurimonas marina]QJA05929.1 tryptophan synthase subunit alpha [Thermosulfurimonas marina]
MIGAERVRKAIEEAHRAGRAALIPYFCAWDPDLETTRALLWAAAEAGASVVELGFPFSDPLADGPIIQAATQRALKHRPTLEAFLEFVAALYAEGYPLPVVVMGYYNPFFRFGLSRFVQAAREAGLGGAIIPDLPLEEARPWLREARRAGLAAVLLAAPTTPPERLERIARASSGFLYYVSVTGITGVRERLPEDLALRLDLAREISPVPVAVGFGISKPEHVRLLSPHAHALVVGSALVRIVEEEGRRAPKRVQKVLSELVSAAER